MLGVGVLASLFLIWQREEPAKIELVELRPLVSIQAAEHRDVPVVVRGFGTVGPQTRVQIVPQVEGTVVEVHPSLKAGGFFNAGELLIRIDATDYELAVEQAGAELKQAEASLANAASTVTDFETRREEAKIDADRMGDLYRQESTTKSELEKSDLALKRADAQLQAARALRVRATGKRATAITKLKIAEVELARTKIRLPFDGRVLSESVDIGQFVSAGPILAEVYGTKVMEIAVPLEDWQLAWFHVPLQDTNDGIGLVTRAGVETDFAGARRQWEGRVVRLEGQIDPISRMANVVVEVEDPFDTSGVMLTPGMFVEIEIHGRTLKDVIAIPRHALRLNGAVWVEEQGKLRFRNVQVMRLQREIAYVRGLQEGQHVITSALDVVSDGMRIRVINSDEWKLARHGPTGDPSPEHAIDGQDERTSRGTDDE